MRHFINATLWLIGSTFIGIEAGATTIQLNFNSLPSAQGWTYSGTVSESSVFSVSGGVLTMDGRGLGDTMARYSFANAVDISQPFTINVSLRVVNADNSTVFFPGFQLGAWYSDGVVWNPEISWSTAKDAGYSIVTPGIATAPPWNQFTAAANVDTGFHDYSLHVAPGGAATLSIDGALVTTGQAGNFGPGTVPDFLYFGDASRESEAEVQIRSYSFSQTVPDRLSTMAGLAMSVLGVFTFAGMAKASRAD